MEQPENQHPLQITLLLESAVKGDRQAAADLLPLVYDELRRLAQRRISGSPGQTLQATALVHEAYLRVIGNDDPGWDGRAHFFAAAATAMRNILVDRARRRSRIKHGGSKKRIELDESVLGMETSPEEVLALEDALVKLEAMDARKSQIITLRFFGGLSMDEIAELLQVSTRTIEREWRFSRAWLARELSGESGAAATAGDD